MNDFIKYLPNEQATQKIGALLATLCPKTFIIYLYGNLGAGKTTFTRGFLAGLGYEGKVKSPTYTIVEPYQIGSESIYHFDFYRLKDPEELEYIGVQDYFVANAICLVEWPEQGGQLLPPADVACYIDPDNTGRQIRIKAHTVLGEEVLRRLHDQ